MITRIVEHVAQCAVREMEQEPTPPHWGDFVLAEGFLDCWEASQHNTYLNAARNLVDSYLARGTDWGADSPFLWAGMALPAFRLYRQTDEIRFREFALALTDRLRGVNTSSDGGIATQPGKSQLWIDMLHFACPAFCERALLTGEREYFDAATQQFRIFVSHLLDPASGLFYHIWDEDNDAHSPMLWSRGNGWLTVAAVEMLGCLPDDHADRESITGVLTRQLERIVRTQDPSGHWHTIMDRPDSKIETSGAAIFGLGMVRGVRLGVLDRSFLGPASKAWHALQDKVDSMGHVFGVTDGTPPGGFEHYQQIPQGVTVFGTGLFLQLGIEMSSL